MEKKATKKLVTSWIVERLKERSTWLAVISLMSLAGITLKPNMSEAFITVGLAVGSLVLLFTKDNKEIKS